MKGMMKATVKQAKKMPMKNKKMGFGFKMKGDK